MDFPAESGLAPLIGWLGWHEVSIIIHIIRHTPLKGEEGQPTYAPAHPPKIDLILFVSYLL